MGVQFNKPSFEAIGYYKHFNSNRKSIFSLLLFVLLLVKKF